jgi:hypothetical protein
MRELVKLEPNNKAAVTAMQKLLQLSQTEKEKETKKHDAFGLHI